jgi:hypothetical protein
MEFVPPEDGGMIKALLVLAMPQTLLSSLEKTG